MRGKRVLVAGASAGIGRAFAVHAVRAGAEVVMGARRTDRLAEVVAEAGGGTAVALDVCERSSREAFVAAAASRLGTFDLVLCTAGWADMLPLAAVADDAWARTMATNVIGPSQLLAAALPALAPGGVAAVLSSETGRRPRSGLVPYAASKAALDAALRGFRLEHPGTRISCIVVGATFPTEFGEHFDGPPLAAALEDWQRHGLIQEEMMAPDEVAGCLVDLLAAALAYPAVGVDEIVLRSPSPVLGTPISPDRVPAEERP